MQKNYDTIMLNILYIVLSLDDRYDKTCRTEDENLVFTNLFNPVGRKFRTDLGLDRGCGAGVPFGG